MKNIAPVDLVRNARLAEEAGYTFTLISEKRRPSRPLRLVTRWGGSEGDYERGKKVTAMTQSPAGAQGKQFLNHVEKGMLVFDRAGHEIGKVDGIFMPAETADPEGLTAKPQIIVAPATVSAPLVPVVATVNSPLASSATDLLPTDDTFPKVLRDRLVNNGFLRIDAGLLHHHRYAMPDQIEAVDAGRVRLKVAEDDLIKH